MSLNATLKELVDNSKKITSIELSTGSPEITDYLLQKNGAKRRLIRDAESQECKLFAISSTESISARIQADLGQHSQSRTTTRRTNIDRILSAANILNQLCNLEDAKTRIEKLAQTHEERQLNVDYLESALKKSESDMEALLNDARNAPSSGDSNVSGSVDEELRRTQVAVEMLENRLQVLKDKGNELQEQIDEQHRLQTAMQQMTQRHTNNDLPSMETMFETEMKTLEEKVASKRKELSDYVSKLNGLAEKARIKDIQRVRHSKVNARESIPAGESDQASIEASKKGNGSRKIREVHRQLLRLVLQQDVQSEEEIDNGCFSNLSNVIAGIFPTAADADGEYKPSHQAIILAKIMDLVEDSASGNGVIPLNQLKTQITEFAKSKGFNEQLGSQSIYKLVASHLLIIDRSQKESMVKLG